MYEIDDKIVSYGGIGVSMFMDEVFELRLGSTLLEYRKNGIMTKLVEYRINEIENKLNGRKGVIQVSTQHYNIYSKYKFTEIFENEIGYKHLILQIN